MGIDRALERARLYLMSAVEPPAPAVSAFVAAHGPVIAAAKIREATAPAQVLAEIARPAPDLRTSLHALDTGDARLITPEDEDWPAEQMQRLAECSLVAPLAMWVRGSTSLAHLSARAITVTGSRASTSYGDQIASDFGYYLARAGATVVTTASFGIAASALRAAHCASGASVAVMACGVDVAFPAAHALLLESVTAHGGMVVSENPIGARPTRQRFVARLRLLAALSDATIIVEAGRRSGALATAKLARRIGRRVYAVPGPLTSATSVGTNELIRHAVATAITAADQVDHHPQAEPDHR